MNPQGYASMQKYFDEIDELKLLLKEARDVLVLCTLIDKSNTSDKMVDKIDKYFEKP